MAIGDTPVDFQYYDPTCQCDSWQLHDVYLEAKVCVPPGTYEIRNPCFKDGSGMPTEMNWWIPGTGISGSADSECAVVGQLAVQKGYSDDDDSDSTYVSKPDVNVMLINTDMQYNTEHGMAMQMQAQLAEQTNSGTPHVLGSMTSDMGMNTDEDTMGMHVAIHDDEGGEVFGCDMDTVWNDENGMAMDMSGQIRIDGDLLGDLSCSGGWNSDEGTLGMDMLARDGDGNEKMHTQVNGEWTTETGLLMDAGKPA